MLVETQVTQRSPAILQFLPRRVVLYQIVLIIRHFATPSSSGNLIPDCKDFKIHLVSLLSEAPLGLVLY